MASDHGLFDMFSRVFVPVHKDGHKFLAIAAGISLVGFLVWSPIGWIAALAALWIAIFFRDPDRVTPLREGLILSAADGLVHEIEQVTAPAELTFDSGMESGSVWRIATTLGPFDVHVNRAPVAGRIAQSVYMPGAFLNPTLEKASEDNERRALLIETPAGVRVAVVQIAGVIARRIVTFVHEGDSVGMGQRFGLIRFGSRVDVYLPEGVTPLVCVGQRMVAGETVLADLKSQEPEREARRS